VTDGWGVDTRYRDALGVDRDVPAAVVRQLHERIGDPDGRPRPLVVRPGDAVRVDPGDLQLEDGTSLIVDRDLPRHLPFGYHTLHGDDVGPRLVIVTPGVCHLRDRWRAWGWAAQLYATRSPRSWGIGDFGDLGQLTRWARSRGAGFVLVNPVGAVAPVTPQQPSPYFPASRRFRNPIYLRVEDVPGADAAAVDIRELAAAGSALNRDRIIDRDRVWQLKRRALEAIWAAQPPLQEFDRWYATQSDSLQQFATWCVLAEDFGARWRDWPAELRDRRPAALADVRDANRDRLRFNAWLQWLIERQLAAAAEPAALVQDLPIGVDPDGFDAWEWQDVLAPDTSVGAPPDEFNRLGQDWGLPPFVPARLAAADYRPFIDTIRASMAAGGGLRIDHVMGLFRLWWIPTGNSPAEGGFVRYPFDDLLAIVALESHRAGAFVVGEDLGTVERVAREALAEHRVLSYRLLWFEEDDPATWPANSLAAVTTHDLPTVAGLWDGSDLEAQRQLCLDPNEESTRAIRDHLAQAAGLDGTAPTLDAVEAAHALLARAPSVLVAATLDDALAEPERPNIPGGDGRRPNWSLALPVDLDGIERHPLTTRIATSLDDAVRGPG
jgi:4-alpha-glucanotransferase